VPKARGIVKSKRHGEHEDVICKCSDSPSAKLHAVLSSQITIIGTRKFTFVAARLVLNHKNFDSPVKQLGGIQCLQRAKRSCLRLAMGV
jgi:hypothetical protein